MLIFCYLNGPVFVLLFIMRVFCKSQLIFGYLILCTVVFLAFYSRTNSYTFTGLTGYSLFPVFRLISSKSKETGSGIPKIIHQIWNDEAIPEVFQENIRGLVAHNRPPKWKYYFWTIKMGTEVIKKEFPHLLKRYLSAANLLKADILRLVVLYKYGGVYFDLDTVSVKPLDPFVESNNCSFVTDPDEHVFHSTHPRKMLLITNSAMLCQPSNWFIKEIIEKLSSQSSLCRDAVQCTGPNFISKHYEYLQGTNKSAKLPVIVDNRYFEDMVDPGRHAALKTSCNEPTFSKVKHEWAKEICRNWIKGGREKRNISDIAYTYHTWFHTTSNPARLKRMPLKNIKELVQNVTFYEELISA